MKMNWTRHQRLSAIVTGGTLSLLVAGAIASSMFPRITQAASNLTAQSPQADSQMTEETVALDETDELSENWRLSTLDEQHAQWDYILNSPLGIAALNQLAIEGFISPLCPKTLYVNEEYGGFQFLMQVECPDPRGASTAVGYDEVHVIFNRFESNIENFNIQRLGQR
jgi:hypothetical protein